jgi:HEPN domain-containing protein
MSSSPRPHSPELVRLCEEAVELLLSLKPAAAPERAERIREIRALLERIGRLVEAEDLRAPGFAEEQGSLVDAWSAVQSIDMDRGGPHVERYVDRAVADVRRLAG